MTHTAWRTLQYLPGGVQTALKRWTSPGLRVWVRERFGADHRNIPDRIVTVVDGRRFRIGPDRVSWSLHHGLPFEPENTSVLRQLVRPSDIIVDAGANFGWFTTLFATVADAGSVWSFEPVPSTCARLHENVALCGVGDRVNIRNMGLGEARGAAKIHLFEHRSHACASLSTLGESEYQPFIVDVTTIDETVAENGLPRVDLIKCDVEGAELSVLRGARNTLSGPDPPTVIVELNDETCEAFGHDRWAIWDLLSGFGYDRFYAVVSRSRIAPVSRERIGSLGVLLAAKGDRVDRRWRNAPRAAASRAA